MNSKGELVFFEASDGLELAGGLFLPELPIKKVSITGVIATHGTGGNFYSRVPKFLTSLIAKRGYTGLSINMRHHDANYATSVLEDCIMDFNGAIKFLQDMHINNIVLVGHSMSTIDVSYYVGKTQNPAVKAIVLYDSHDNLPLMTKEMTGAENYENQLRKARELVVKKKESDLLVGQNARLVRSAKTFLSWSGPESDAVVTKWIQYVKIPILLIESTIDPFAARGLHFSVRANRNKWIKKAATSTPRCDIIKIEGADHSFQGFEDDCTRITADWLIENNILPTR